METIFNRLNAVNVNGKTETKGRLTYLSWVWAWGEVKKLYPKAFYTIYENKDGLNYHHDGKTAWVKTGVTIEGLEHIEYLPVMDNRNASITLNKITSFDVNKAIQRSITKAIARHGLGLYLYAGEDLPEGEEQQKAEPKPQKVDFYRRIKAAGNETALNQIYKEARDALSSSELEKIVAACSERKAEILSRGH